MEYLKKIKELNELRKKGILTDEEFESEKNKILGTEAAAAQIDNSPKHNVEFNPVRSSIENNSRINNSLSEESVNNDNIVQDVKFRNNLNINEEISTLTQIDNGEKNLKDHIEIQNASRSDLEMFNKRGNPKKAYSRKHLFLLFSIPAVLATVIIIGYSFNFGKNEQEKKILMLKGSCEKNDGKACTIVGYEFKDMNNNEKALEFFEKGCTNGVAGSCWEASIVYESKNDLHNKSRLDEIGCRLQWVESCYRFSQDLYKNGKLEDALAILKRSINYDDQQVKLRKSDINNLIEVIQKELTAKDVVTLINICSTWHGGSSPLCVSEGQRYEEDGNFEVASQFYLKHKEKCTQGACVTGASTGLARLEYKKKNFLKAIELYNNDCISWHQPSCFMSGLIEINHNDNPAAGEKKINYWCDVFKLDVCGIFSKADRFSQDSDFLKRLVDELNCSEEVGKIRAESYFNHGNFLVSNGDSKIANQYFGMACKQGIQAACK